MNVADLIATYDQLVPRYTGDPSAPHVTTAVDADMYAEWLRTRPSDMALSLYLHVLFCAQLCLLCGRHTTTVHRTEPLITYTRTLLREIGLLAGTIGRRLPVRHIRWGGGHPTALPADCMTAITTRLASTPITVPSASPC
ncbi:MAG TPA: hypothetical protein VK726_19190 [Acetobacteraceae bacterium]|jgi:oxygen-independent coproporphyrinogen-3 oxidase|nr:hypothetical protein [Acetobacteraceae bacterium]